MTTAPKYNAVIIDDTLLCTTMLADLITEHFENINIVSICNSGQQGLEAIKKHEPDLIFLDVEMPGMSGFEMLSHFNEFGFDIVFTTTHDKYSMQAFKASAIDYLLKPVTESDLRAALKKIEKKKNHLQFAQVQQLFTGVQQMQRNITRIALPTMEGLSFVNVADIIHAEADDNNTMIHFVGGHKILITKTLKGLEMLLQHAGFCRIHQSHLVSLQHIKKYVRGNGGYVVMNNNVQISVARNRKEMFLEQIAHL